MGKDALLRWLGQKRYNLWSWESQTPIRVSAATTYSLDSNEACASLWPTILRKTRRFTAVVVSFGESS